MIRHLILFLFCCFDTDIDIRNTSLQYLVYMEYLQEKWLLICGFQFYQKLYQIFIIGWYLLTKVELEVFLRIALFQERTSVFLLACTIQMIKLDDSCGCLLVLNIWINVLWEELLIFLKHKEFSAWHIRKKQYLCHRTYTADPFQTYSPCHSSWLKLACWISMLSRSNK